jgi:hypothetical protein
MREQTLIFGAEEHLVGTVTLPTRAEASRAEWMVLLTNAGVIPRVGPHRFNVHLARRFAELGMASLRFDMSGLGDSRRPMSTLSANDLFVADTRAAMDIAAQRYGAQKFLMLGICSGADIAYMTALEDDRLRAMVLFDSYAYPTVRAKCLGLLHRLRRDGVMTTLGKLARHLTKPRAAQTAADPGIVPSVGEAVAEGPSIYGRTRMPTRDDFGRRIRTLVDRGRKIFFIYSGGEPDWYNYEGEFRDMFATYGFVDRVAYEYIVSSDHTITQPRMRACVIASVERWCREQVFASSGDPASALPQRAGAVSTGSST